MTDDERRALRRKLLAKGKEIADMLAALLAGKSPAGADLLGGEPGETKEERLRRWLNLVQSRIDAINAGSYGRCERCGEEIPLVELQENPVADVCAACAAAADH